MLELDLDGLRRLVERLDYHHYRGFCATQRKLIEKEEPKRVKPVLYAYRVLMTGIHLMRTGEVEANLLRLNEHFGFGFLDDPVAQKTAEQAPADLDWEFHAGRLHRLLAGNHLVRHEVAEELPQPAGDLLRPEGAAERAALRCDPVVLLLAVPRPVAFQARAEQVQDVVVPAIGVRTESGLLVRQELVEYLVDRLGRFVGAHAHHFSSSMYCGGLFATRLVTLGYLPLGTLSSMATTSIWCHQSSP